MKRNIHFIDIYANYRNQAVALLKEQIKNERKKSIIQTDYEDAKAKCVFSVVELDNTGKLVKIYQICPASTFKRNLKYIKERLEYFHKITKAEVFWLVLLMRN